MMIEEKLTYKQWVTWDQIQYKYYALMDHFKNSYSVEELWSKVPLE